MSILTPKILLKSFSRWSPSLKKSTSFIIHSNNQAITEVFLSLKSVSKSVNWLSLLAARYLNLYN